MVAKIWEATVIFQDILNTVMMSWEADERENLSRDLVRSRQERDVMKTRIERLTRQLKEAQAELEVYRREGVLAHTSSSKEIVQPMIRSRSATNIEEDVTDKQEVHLWREKCGTMFRELNAMRSGYQ
ncbi:unnamed protein product, partial [Strongylus vulgaris]